MLAGLDTRGPMVGRGKALATRLANRAGVTIGSVGLGTLVAINPIMTVVGAVIVAGVALAVTAPFVLIAGLVTARNVTDVFAPSGAAPTSGNLDPSALLGLAMLGATGVLVVLRRKARIPLPIVAVTIGIVLWYGLSLVNFGQRPAFNRELVRSVSILALGIAMSNWRVDGLPEKVTALVLWATVGPAAVAIGQIAIHLGSFQTGSWRSAGTFAHSDTAAVAFATCVLVSYWRMRRGAPRYSVFLGIYVVALLSTGSLGGLVQAIVGLLILSSGGLRPTRGHLKWLGVIVVLVGLYAATPTGQSRLAGLATTQSPSVAAEGYISNSSDWRFLNWAKLLEEWTHRPVLGYGLGTTTEVGLVTPLQNLPHNDYIRLLVETGVLGFAVFGLLVVMLFARVQRLVRVASDQVPYPLLILALIASILVECLGTDISLDTAPDYLLALLIGAAFVVPFSASNPKKASDPAHLWRRRHLRLGDTQRVLGDAPVCRTGHPSRGRPADLK